MAGFSEDQLQGRGLYGPFPDSLLPDLYLLEGGQVSTGSILSWFKRTFCLDLPEQEVYSLLDAEAARVPPGSEGLIVLDSFQGNRTPHSDSSARGAVWGLSLNTTRAQVFRALMEGVAYGTRQVLEAFRAYGVSPGKISACGGITQSRLFTHILADVCGLPVGLTDVPDAALLGGAILIAAGLGYYPSIADAARAMVRPTEQFEPDTATHQIYSSAYPLYQHTYERLHDLMAQSRNHSLIR
jgi:ribulose kinase